MIERPGVVAQHLAVDMNEPNKITMLYKVRHGFEAEDHYGLALARVVDLPPEILSVAEEVSKTLQAQAEAKKKSSGAYIVARKRKLVLGLHETLKQARDGAMDGNALSAWLTKLQTEFVLRMSELDEHTVSSEESAEDENEDDQDSDFEQSMAIDRQMAVTKSESDEKSLEDDRNVYRRLGDSIEQPLEISNAGSEEEDDDFEEDEVRG